MAATAALLHKPTFQLYSLRPSELVSFKPTLLLLLPASRSVFFSGFCSKKTVSKATSAFRSTDGKENIKMLQQDTLVKESSEFRSQFIAREFEPLLNRLSKWVAAASFGGLLLWRHDAEALWMAMGSVLNAQLSATLKQIFNQERPSSTSKSDPGMPSSHAQCLFYIVVFCSLSCAEWVGANEISLLITAFNVAFGSYFSWLRVLQQYHTPSQVVVGAAFGSGFSLLWYLSWQTIVLEAFNSSLWVRVVVVLATASFCSAFLLYVIRNWLKDED